MLVIVKGIATLLFADFVTGFVHWMEDSYWSPETPILGKWLVEPNLAHHKNGQDFLKKSWWESSWDLLITGTLILLFCYLEHRLTWEVWLFSLVIINANQIHKWAHITRDENKPKIVALLQKLYILQTTKHHGQHHRKPNNSHYCTVLNVLNPVLDRLHFWRSLEVIVGKHRKK